MEAIRKEHGADIDTAVSPGGPGEYVIFLDGEPIFDKAMEGRFPSNEEILAQISHHKA